MNQEISENIEMLNKIDPLCPVFGECGGCAYQDLPYPEELRVKGEMLRGLLQKELGLEDSVFEPVVPSPKPYHYRSRVDIGVYRSKQGDFKMGFMREGMYRVIPVDSCAIADEKISAFLPELFEQVKAKWPEKYRVANLVVKTGDDGRIFWGGVGRRSLEMKEEDYLWTEINGKRIYYSLDTFFQANLSILPLLMEKISRLVRLDKGTLFLDLYGGAGLFGLSFADKVQKVVLIEEYPASTQVAKYSAQYHQLNGRFEIISEKVETALPRVLRNRTEYRCVGMIDPPRKGLSPTSVSALTSEEALDPKKGMDQLLYLSCHPESLARDLKLLIAGGWQVRKVVPFDFFPKTRHLETLVLLEPSRIQKESGRLLQILNDPNLLEIEIGCGKGKFLEARAAREPEINFMGIDRAGKWMKKRLLRAEEKEGNLLFIKADIYEALEHWIPRNRVSVFHVYFPDPWPKRRHRGRRILTADFYQLLYERLLPDGKIEIATDDLDYFSQIKKEAAKTAHLWKSKRETVNNRIFEPDNKTNYELKFEKQGKDLFYLELVK